VNVPSAPCRVRTLAASLAALVYCAGAASAQGPAAPPTAAQVLETIEALGTTPTAASERIDGWRGDKAAWAAISALRGGRDGLLGAMLRARELAADKKPIVQLWVSHYGADLLEAFGHLPEACELLVDVPPVDASASPQLRESFARILLLRAQLCSALDRPNEAEALARQALAAIATDGAPHGRGAGAGPAPVAMHGIVCADAMAVLGELALARGVLHEAGAWFEAQRLAAGSADAAVVALATLNKARLELASGRHTRAATTLAGDPPDEEPLRSAWRLVAALARAGMARDDDAAQQAIAALRPLTVPPAPVTVQVSAAAALAALYVDRGDGVAATAFMAIAKGRGSAATETPAAEIVAIETTLAARRGDAAALGALRATCSRELERMRARWSQAAIRPGGQSFLAYQSRRQLLASFVEACVGAGRGEAGVEDAWREVLLCQAMASRARLRNANSTLPTVTPEALRASELTARGGVLFLLAAGRGSHALGVDRQGFFHVDLPRRDDVVGAVGDLNERLQCAVGPMSPEERTRTGADACASSSVASALLLPELLRRRIAAWKTVLLVDCGLMRGVPFESMLWSDDAAPALVGERFAVTHTDSLQLEFGELGRALPVGAPRLSCGADGIAPQELDPWSAPYGDRICREETLATGAGAAFTQVVAHGAVSDDPEFFQELVFTSTAQGSQRLGFEDVRRLEASGLVILSICGAARGGLRVGDGHFTASLGGAFLLAGAHSVVQSRADVVFEVHRPLMASFHRHLAAGAATAEALRAARASVAGGSWYERFDAAQVQVIGAGFLAPCRR
jgi:hypothetical protein